MRQLASIKRIDNINLAENADSLELAIIGGWQVVTRKDEFKAGDLCVYMEIDSILPETEWAEFMRAKKFRVRTIKLRGNLSQGLVFPLSILPDWVNPTDDLDVTDILGIIKWEPEIAIEQEVKNRNKSVARNDFPTHLVPKTDETRIQSVLKCIEELKGKPYYITVKCDGTSTTDLYDGDNFLVCSRNQIVYDENSVYRQIAKKYDLPSKLAEHKNWACQSELCGKIQGNKLGLSDFDMFTFNIWDIEKQEYLNFVDFVVACEELKLKTVPILEAGDNFQYTFEELLELADGKYDGTNNWREGIVVRAQDNSWSEKLRGRLSFKVISNKFLLKEDN